MHAIKKKGRKTMFARGGGAHVGHLLLVPVQRESGIGSARLVSIEDLGQICTSEPATADSNSTAFPEENNLFDAFQATSVHAAWQDAGNTTDVTRPPVRNIRDTDPIYSSVGVDMRLNEVFLQDSNTWSIRVFNRLDNTSTTAQRTEPKRVISGPKTDIQFNSCVWIDPTNGDIYSVENDIGDSIVVFSHDAEGDLAPKRHLKITHRGYAMTADEEKQERCSFRFSVLRRWRSTGRKPLEMRSLSAY